MGALTLSGTGTYSDFVYSFTPNSDGTAEITVSTTTNPVLGAEGDVLTGVGRELRLQLQSTTFPYLPPSDTFNPWVPVQYGSSNGYAQQSLVVADGMSIIRARQAANLAGRVAWGAVAGSDSLGPEMAGDIALGLTPGIGVYTDIRDVAKNLIKFMPLGLGNPDKQELVIAGLGILTEFLPPVDYITDAYRTVYKLAKGAAEFAPLLWIMEPLFESALQEIWTWASRNPSFFAGGILNPAGAVAAMIGLAGGDDAMAAPASSSAMAAQADASAMSLKQFEKFLTSLSSQLGDLPKWLDFLSGLVGNPANFDLLGRMLRARGGAVMLESMADLAHQFDPGELFDALRKSDDDLRAFWRSDMAPPFDLEDIDYMLPAALETLRKAIDGAEAGDLADILQGASPDDFADILSDIGRIAWKEGSQNLNAMTAGASDLADAIAHSVDTGLFKSADQIKGVLDDVTLIVEQVDGFDVDRFAAMLRDVTDKWRSTRGAPFSRGIWYQFEAAAEMIRRGDIDPKAVQLDYRVVRGDDPSRWLFQLDIYLPASGKIIDPKSYTNGLPSTGKALQALKDQAYRHLEKTGATSYAWVSPKGVAGGDLTGFIDEMREYLEDRLKRSITIEVMDTIPDRLMN